MLRAVNQCDRNWNPSFTASVHLTLGAQPISRDFIPQLEIAHETQRRIYKGSRTIQLEEEMADPSESVSDHKQNHRQAPVLEFN